MLYLWLILLILLNAVWLMLVIFGITVKVTAGIIIWLIVAIAAFWP